MKKEQGDIWVTNMAYNILKMAYNILKMAYEQNDNLT